MIRANFETVATILALHVDSEIAKALHLASKAQGDQFEALKKLAEAPIVSSMHDAYECFTSKPTPLHIYPIFVGALHSFIENKGYGSIGEFIDTVHTNIDKIKSDLAKVGVTIEYDSEGISISTNGKIDFDGVEEEKTTTNNVIKLH